MIFLSDMKYIFRKNDVFGIFFRCKRGKNIKKYKKIQLFLAKKKKQGKLYIVFA